MTEEIKKAVAEQLDSFKASLNVYADKESMNKAFAEFKTEVSKSFDGVVKSEDFAKLEKAIEVQGALLQSLETKGQSTEKNFRQMYAEKMESIAEAVSAGKAISFNTTRKSVTSSNFTDSTLAYRETEVGQIKRGVPFLRDLFQVVTLGGNTGDTVRWHEQLAVTNNASNTAEATKPTTQSNITWVEKSLNGKRISDFIKIGKDRIKDVDFVIGEVQNLVNRNMRLKENSQLLSGVGTGNDIKGVLEYAQAFVTTGIAIQDANLVDLMGKIKTQISVNMLGQAMPNYVLSNNSDIDLVRFKKDKDNGYLFPNWALGGNVSVGGLSIVENPLITANTMLVGDFAFGTVYAFDDLIIEIKEVEDDALNGLVTIIAYMRENLRVKDVDVNAFVKVSDITATIAAINEDNG